MDNLYPFQQVAVDKLWTQKSILIGDEMGTGKTVMGIAIDVMRREHHDAKPHWRTLVLTYGTAMVDAWAKHFAAWAPELEVVKLDPKNRGAFIQKVSQGKGTVFISTWTALHLMPQLAKTKWFHVIGDEIQAIKNRDAKVTLALKKIKTVYKSGLSGTAADNRPDDLWSILNWLYPNHWTSYWSWYNNHILFTNELNHKTGKVYRKMVGVANVDEIHGDMDSFYIARLKKDVFHDLPDKYYTDIEVDLAPQQRSAYNQMRDTMLAWIGEHEHEPIAAPVVIAQLMRLQQFAVGYGKLEPVKRRNPRTGEMELVDTLKLTEPSSKLDAVMEQILTNPDEQFVVFSQSKQVINLLATRLEKAKITHCLFTGDTKQEVRPQMVDDFQAGKYQVFAGTIHAGGVGITLTAASTVIFIDRAWSPSRNKQAEDRLHRPGQKNAVQVINIVARDTIDPDRNAQIQLKWEWLSELLRRGISD